MGVRMLLLPQRTNIAREQMARVRRASVFENALILPEALVPLRF